MIPIVKSSANTINVPLYQPGSNALATGLSFEAGDVLVSVDGGSLKQIASLPTEAPSGSGYYDVDLSSAESGDRVTIQITDQTSPKAWDDLTVFAGGSLATTIRDLILGGDKTPIQTDSGKVTGTLPDNAITSAKLADSAVAKIEAALLNDGDGQALIDAIVQAVDAADISTNLTVALIRDGILNRALAGNHDAAGTVGAFLQQLDAAITSRLAGSAYTQPDNGAAQSAASSAATAATQATTAASTAAAIKAKTDNLPASPASTGDVTGAAPDLSEVLEDLGTLLGRIPNVLASSRIAITTAVAGDGTARVYKGTDYNAALGNQLSFSRSGFAANAFDGASGIFRYRQDGGETVGVGTVTVAQDADVVTAVVTLTGAQTQAMTADISTSYEIALTTTGDYVQVPWSGKMIVSDGVPN